MIPHSRPSLGYREQEAVSRVIASKQIAAGEESRAFEADVAGYVGRAHAAAVSSGTAALHLTLLAMGIGPGHEVVVPSYVCTALIHAVSYVGAKPVLADIHPRTGSLDPDDVIRRRTQRTRAVIVPHLLGRMAELAPFLDMDIPIIEDCAQSIGATQAHWKAGGIGRAAVFSFYATKVITTGEGGMVITDDAELIETIRDLRDYDGKTPHRLRFNYKMTDMAAAMGRVQLDKLNGLIETRRSIARQYDEAFVNIAVDLPPSDPGHIYYRYVLQSSEPADAVIQQLREAGIAAARPISTPLHQILGQGGFPHTEAAHRRSVSIPIYPSLSPSAIKRVIDGVASIYSNP